MPYLPLEFPPGIYRNGTERQAKGRWYDGNQVRFYNGHALPRPSGAHRSTAAVTGKGRRIIGWRDSTLTRWCAVGTESHLYALGDDGVLHDITPSPFTTGTVDAPVDGSGFATGDVTMWSLDLFGQYLVGCTADDGNIYEWTLNTATPAAVVTGSPPTARAIVMTDERFLFALGAAGVPRRVQWPDQASLTVWTPARPPIRPVRSICNRPAS